MGVPAIRIGIIIQARMGSTRLPGKVLKPVGRRPLLGLVLGRLERLEHAATVVVATTTLAEDDVIEAFCRQQCVECFRGSELNVLQRYFLCAEAHGFDQIVRLTADNPFTDIVELDGLIRMHLDANADFSHSFASLPVGVGAEVFSFAALRESYRCGRALHHLEHVDEYMLENPDVFVTREYLAPNAKRRPEIRLTVDTQVDYARACAIVAAAGNDFPTTREAIEYCSQSA